MKDNRPVNLDMNTIQLPLPAIASILHRASGVFIFVGMAVLIYALDCSLASPEGFAAVQDGMQSFTAKLIIWSILYGLIYQSVAGVKHLILDMGVGESLEGGILGAKITFGVSAVLILLAGVWVW